MQLMRKRSSIERVDRISHLPEKILHHILSFLCFKQAAQTCILSKTWEKAWHTFPYLRFGFEFFNQRMQDFPILPCDPTPTLFEPTIVFNPPLSGPDDPRYKNIFYNMAKAEKTRFILLHLYLLNYVEESLRKRYNEMVTIEDFVLEFGINLEFFSPIMDRCIGYALGCHVKKMQISTGFQSSSDKSNMYILPQNVLRAESLHVLELIGVRLESPMVLCSKSLHNLYLRRVRLKSPMVLCAESLHVLQIVGVELESARSVKLSSLKKLSLEDVSATGGVIYTIIVGCPLIEDISLLRCRGFESLKLLSLPELKDLNLNMCLGFESLKLFDLPKLKNVGVNNYKVKLWEMNVHSLHYNFGYVTSCKVDAAFCKNLNSLILHKASILDEYFCNQLLPNLPVLDYLSLRCCNNLERIKISSFSLQRLCIRKCLMLVEIKFETPNLSEINYTGDLISFSFDGFTLSKTDLSFFTKQIHSDTQWYFNYIELVKKFHSLSKKLTLTLLSARGEIFPVELRQTISPLFCGVKNFKIHIDIVLSVKIKNVVDDWLWLSPHAKTLSIQIRNSIYFEFEFSYKKEPTHEGEICECCKSVPITCWRQCIEKVEVKYTARYYFKQIKQYVFEGEEIWEKMDCLQELPTN